MFHSFFNNRTAFSLIEIVTVVLIIGIISAVAVPKVYDSMNSYHLTLAADTIIADLKYARQEARSRSQSISIIFDLTNDSYTISDVSSRNHPGQSYVVNLQDSKTPADITDVKNGPVIVFNQYGIPGGDHEIDLVVGNDDITIAIDEHSGRVSIK